MTIRRRRAGTDRRRLATEGCATTPIRQPASMRPARVTLIMRLASS